MTSTQATARADLADLADAVLPDIGHLPAWLDGQRHDPQG